MKKKLKTKDILKITSDSEKMFNFNDSLSKVIKEEYQNYELTNSELSFATGGKKESYRKISKDKYNM